MARRKLYLSLLLAVLRSPSLSSSLVSQFPPMLDYVKMILLKVSFSKTLFEKELRKALKVLQPLEIGAFRTWCYSQFARVYRRILKRVFGAIALA